MKAALSIPLIFLIFFTGINVSFSVHYCGGTVFATKISLKGEIATCGMEHSSSNTSLQDIFKTQCCDDITSSLSICNHYIPSSYIISDPGQDIIQVYTIPADIEYSRFYVELSSPTGTRPPGINVNYRVSQPSLCVFRI